MCKVSCEEFLAGSLLCDVRLDRADLGGGDGTSGCTMSVRTKLEIEESESSAAVSAWPMKPAAPVMRMFMVVEVWESELRAMTYAWNPWCSVQQIRSSVSCFISSPETIAKVLHFKICVYISESVCSE